MLNNKQLNKLIKENIHNLLLFESQESDSQKLAKNLYQQSTGCSREDADNFVRNTLRNDITSLRDKKIAKFTLGVTRMFLDRQITNANIISDLNVTLKLLLPHINEYDKNLNNLSAQELINRFKQVRLNNLENEKNEINSMSFGESNYNIVRIDSYEQAQQYKQYTYPKQPWCLTYMENMFDSYTSNGINQIYFCLLNGFENIKPEVGANAPLDDYGLSMLCIIVNENGELAYCTSRWNHENGGNDSIMSPKQISEVVGVNFYTTFKPNGKWNEIITNAQQRLSNGENPKDIFDWVKSFSEGFAWVRLNDKWNFLNPDGKLISDQWFDWVGDFCNDFARVRLNSTWNFLNTNGKLISEQWFDEIDNFKNGFARVELNDKWNFINTDGKIISDQWFDDVWYFQDGFARVKFNGKYNYLNTNGKLLSKQWFDRADNFKNGFGRIKLKGKEYYLHQVGMENGNNSYAHVVIENYSSKYKLLTQLVNMEEQNINESLNISSFNIKKELNPTIWKNEKLDSRVRLKLLDIADDFIDFLNVDWVKPLDITFTGSLSNYNWDTKHSDIDLHIIYDFKKVDKRVEFVKEYFDSKKSLWNQKHKDIKIFGFPIEVYVQDKNEPHASTGVYSLEKNEWKIKPQILKSIDNKQLQSIAKRATSYATKIDNLSNYKDNLTDGAKERISNKLDSIFQDIKNKRNKGVNRSGELDKDNILFKMLRRNGYIDKIINTKNDIYNDLMSINEGCWGYGLKDDDRVLDTQNEFVQYIIQYLLKKLKNSDSKNPKYNDDSFSWFVLLQDFLLYYKNEEPSSLEIYQQALTKCCDYCEKIINNDFTQGYSESQKMQKTLKDTLKSLEKCFKE